ncbi:YraN family protein [Pseudoflavonifractor sp. 60]|uniref:YraN family protein n=1 Tax=Pseudoflavonifractor sp. 60 TaxID=2304576 RepID=UPI00136DE95D|nr:YraN family protein [Pseudoflavonifractor sp. 60]
MSGQASRLLGRWGEDQAAAFLRDKGFTITAANWSCRFGELDLVAEDGTYLCFVEVKLRKSDTYGTAAACVDQRKQRKLRTTAELYLAEHPTGLQPRFDVVEIYAPQGIQTKSPELRHWKNAF